MLFFIYKSKCYSLIHCCEQSSVVSTGQEGQNRSVQKKKKAQKEKRADGFSPFFIFLFG